MNYYKEKTLTKPDQEVEDLRKHSEEFKQIISTNETAFEDLTKSEKLFRNFFEKSRDAIVITKKDGTYVVVNQAYLNLFGYKREELVGHNVLKIYINKEDRKRYQKLIEKKEFLENLEWKFRRKDGTIIDVMSNTSVWRADDGKIIGYWGIVRDITEQKKAEIAQRLQSEITRNMSEGVNLIRASDGVILYTNPKFEEIFGYSPGEMVGKHISIVNALPEMTPEETADHIFGIIKQTGEWRGEIKNRKKDGTCFWCYMSCSSFNHPEYGEIIIAVYTDITKRKKAEIELKKHLLYEKILYQIVSMAININDLGEYQNYCLNLLGRNLDISRVYIIEYNLEMDIMSNTFEYTAEDIKAKMHNLQNIPGDLAINMNNILISGKIINTNNVNEIPDKFMREIFKSGNVRSILNVPLFVFGKYYGFIGYDECKYNRKWNDEDLNFLKTVANIMVRVIERKFTEETLKESESMLKKQKLSLEQKNIALIEVIGQVETEKNKIKDNIATNVNGLILPILEKFKVTDVSNEYIDLLWHLLGKLTSSFGRKITKPIFKLTPREIEICTMIENGLRNKEISRLFNISCYTVEKHRRNIRKKLDIANKTINLTSFLQQLHS